MKTYIIIFIVVLAITCWVNDAGGPPYKYQVSFSSVEGRRLGIKREAGLIPELAITDEIRSPGMMTKIDEGSEGDGLIDFPYNARN